MRTIRVIAVAALLLPGVATVARTAATDDTPPAVESIEFSRERLEVSGLDVKLLVVTVHLTDETGVLEWDSVDRGHFPALAIAGQYVSLSLGRGTSQDGWYTGGVAVTSGWPATNRPTRAAVMDTEGNEAFVDLATGGIDLPTVAVDSSNHPNLKLLVTPDPATIGDAITRTVKVTDAAGRVWPGVPVQVRYDNECVEYLTSAPDGRTNASGVYTAPRWPAGQNYEFGICAMIVSESNVPEQGPTFIAGTSSAVTYRYKVAAVPAATSVPAGTNVEVNGNLQPAQQRKELQLQRLYSGGEWRTVNRGSTRASSRFTIIATPPGSATYSYRVFAPAGDHRAAATSPVFTIRGT
ncbi:hypothetical protein [Actinoplanes sp. NPDC049265]|uniref:hypothetical protein n=1 Tax=Actinoplanes sp. NPDC049265 TaxID=3363902 RepID=UPI0037235831